MRTFGFLGLLALTALATVPAISQGIAPDGKIHTRIEGIDIPSVANAPFTAKVVVTWDQPLVGGGTISRQYYTQVARDAQGRVHREIREFVPINSSTDPPLRSFTIIDPVAGSRTSCQMDAMNCTVLDYRAPLTSAGLDANPPAVNSKGFTRQSLGQQTMDALPVVGTRETTTSVEGTTHGNTRDVVRTKEMWYSPDLKIYLSVIRKDPQMGQISLTVTNLLREAPDPSWFAPPSDFKVVDARNNQSASR